MNGVFNPLLNPLFVSQGSQGKNSPAGIRLALPKKVSSARHEEAGSRESAKLLFLFVFLEKSLAIFEYLSFILLFGQCSQQRAHVTEEVRDHDVHMLPPRVGQGKNRRAKDVG